MEGRGRSGGSQVIHLSIYDGSLETPFREIGVNLSSSATNEEIAEAAKDLLKSHQKLRTHETSMQKEYNDV